MPTRAAAEVGEGSWPQGCRQSHDRQSWADQGDSEAEDLWTQAGNEAAEIRGQEDVTMQIAIQAQQGYEEGCRMLQELESQPE